MAAELHALDQRRLIDSNGIASASTIGFYLTGTTTPATIYSDAGLTTPLPNPVPVNAGAAVPDIYLDSAVTYRRIITYADGSTDDADPYNAPFVSLAALAASGGSGSVGFLQSGAGAVAITAQEMFRNISINPKQFGCALDGVTDDTVNFQKVITRAIATPGAVIDLGGRTAYCGALELSNCRGLTIRNGYIKVKGDVTWLKGATAATSITFVKIENIFFDASEHTATGRALIDWSKFTYSTFSRLWVYNATGGKTIGFYAAGDGVVGPYYNLFEMIYGGGCFAGIQIATAATVVETVNNNTIRNCRFNPGAVGRFGVFIGTNNQQNRIVDCVLEDTVGGTGIYDDGIGTQIIGTRFEGLSQAMEFGANAAGGTDIGSYFDSNTSKRFFAGGSALLHNIIGELDGAGGGWDSVMSLGLKLGGGLRLRGNQGFPGDLTTGQGHSYASPTLGHVITGYGSTNDITLLNFGGQVVASVPTGFLDFALKGHLDLEASKTVRVGAQQVVGARGAAIADPTDAATTQAAVISILNFLRGWGAIST